MTAKKIPRQDEQDTYLIEIARRNVIRVIKAIDQALDDVEAGETAALSDIPKYLTELRKAMQTAMDERKRLDEQKRKEGQLGAGEIDFEAARNEVLDRLARLKKSQISD